MPPNPEHDYDDDDGGDPPNGTASTPSQNDLRNLRKKAKERDELAAKLERLERNEAFRDAGLDLKDAKAKYFMKGYDGDMTPEAIKAEALSAGFLSEAPPPPDPDADAHRRMDQANAGATSPSGKKTPQEWAAEFAAAEELGQDALYAKFQEAGLSTSYDSQ